MDEDDRLLPVALALSTSCTSHSVIIPRSLSSPRRLRHRCCPSLMRSFCRAVAGATSLTRCVASVEHQITSPGLVGISAAIHRPDAAGAAIDAGEGIELGAQRPDELQVRLAVPDHGDGLAVMPGHPTDRRPHARLDRVATDVDTATKFADVGELVGREDGDRAPFSGRLDLLAEGQLAAGERRNPGVLGEPSTSADLVAHLRPQPCLGQGAALGLHRGGGRRRQATASSYPASLSGFTNLRHGPAQETGPRP